MRGPRPPAIDLNEPVRAQLEQLMRRHSTPQQIVLRGKIVLLAASGLNNAQIAAELAISIGTVRLWRRRWLALEPASLEELPIADRLADAPRPGKPRRIVEEQVCQIVALACEVPEQSGRPISQWTGREIADEIKRRGIVDAISPRHAARLLKRGHSNRTVSATG